MGENIYEDYGTEYEEESELDIGLTEYDDTEEEMNIFENAKDDETITIKGKQRYRIINDSKRGGGNQSSVYSCYGDDEKEYIVKLYNKKSGSFNSDKLEDVLERLQKNRHENVTKILEYGKCQIAEEEYYYVIMNVYQPIDKSIFVWKNEDSDTYQKTITQFIEDMNEALRFLHKNEIFHGDIKPENIMIDPVSNKYVLIDFGGAAKTAKAGGTSVDGGPTTYRYIAPEAVRSRKFNRYTDYYSFGVTLAEFLVGVYPSEEYVKKKIKDIKIVGAFRVPENLPEYYTNLLRGLLYADNSDSKENIEAFRWENQKVESWLGFVGKKNLAKAAEINNIPLNMIGMQEQTADSDSEYDFGSLVILPLGKGRNRKKESLTNLRQMADTFLHPDRWNSAVERFLNISAERNPFSHIARGDIRDIIQDGIDRIQRAKDNKKGLSVNAEFFKFMIENVSDAYIYPKNAESPTFYWIDLPGVENLDGFCGELREVLLDRQKNNGEFGEWWTQIRQKNKEKHAVIAEIFRNNVLSTYLERVPGVSDEVKKQCEKVETYFEKMKTSYTRKELTEMFVLQRMLAEMNWYELNSGKEYESYDQFLKDLEAKAYDVDMVEETKDIMRSVKDESGFYPDFLAWKRLSGN